MNFAIFIFLLKYLNFQFCRPDCVVGNARRGEAGPPSIEKKSRNRPEPLPRGVVAGGRRGGGLPSAERGPGGPRSERPEVE